MRTFIRTLIVSLSLSFLVACGGSPIGKALNHEKAMLKIVEANKDDGDKAKAELEKYVADNKAELDSLKTELEKVKAEVEKDESKAMSLMMDHVDALSENEKLKDSIRESKAYDNDDVRKLLRVMDL